MPTLRLFPCIAAAIFAAVLLASCGGKEPESKKEGASAPEVAPTPAPESATAPSSPSLSPASHPEQADGVPAATEEEKSAASNAAIALMKTRRDSLRRVALATAKLDSRSRALEKSDDPVIQAAVKLVNDRQLALAAAKATVEAAEASLAAAIAERDKAFATDTVWAEFKAEMDAVEKEEADLRARLQLQMANAHKRGFHLSPPAPAPEAAPAPVPEAVPAPAPEAAPAPAPEAAPAPAPEAAP